MIASALFYLIIYPIQMLIDLCYFVTLHLLGNENPVYGLLGVSAMISLCTLPIYLRAEKWQEKERAIQKAMSARVAKIKAAFSGDERQMMLQTYYKQNAYHPVYALRNSLGVLFQVPFFIAAYYYISHLSALQGVPFLAIKDLSRPDALLAFGAFNINVLPIVMTLINIVSGAVYAKDLPFKDKAQLYVMSALFLVLLYDSPAGLVIYWTANNVFSLIKNIIEKSKSPKKIVAIGFFCIIGAAIIYVLGFHQGYFPKRVVTAAALLALAAAPFVALKIKKFAAKKEIFLSFRLYLISCLTLFFLTGLVIPSSIIASSVEEFSFIEAATRPFPFIGMCALQAAGIFLAWTMILYFLFSNRVKQTLTFAMLLVAIMGIVNVFLVKVDYGFLQNMLYFSDEKSLRMEKITSIATSSFLFILVPVLFIIAYSKKTKKFFIGFGSVMAAALLCLGIVNIARIEQDFRVADKNKERYDATYEKVFNFSKDKKNVLFILLDMMLGSYIPHIFDEKPELASEFDGFTWFPNTVSYANHTWIGSVPCYGGYEYTPFEINKRQDAVMMQKRKEAYLLLPTLFADSGYKVTVTDPLANDFRLSNLSIFKDDPRLNALNIKGRYTKRWLENHKEIHAVNITEILTDRLLRFSFFKMAPLFLRAYVYNGGHYLSVQYEFGKPASDYTAALIDSYALIDQAPELTTFEESAPTFSSVYLALAHEPAYMQAPDR